MLAQSFLTAAELGITEPQRDALQKTLVLLETGKLRHVTGRELNDYEKQYVFSLSNKAVFSGEFNMNTFGTRHHCGTVACIGGTAEIVGNVKFVGLSRPEGLELLFYPDVDQSVDITIAQAATALRSYLTTGDAKWSEAVS